MSCLYILDIKQIFCKYFLPVHRLPFHFVYDSFAMQKLLSLIRSHLFFILFILSWETDLRKRLAQFMSKNILHEFSSRSFMVSCLFFSF